MRAEYYNLLLFCVAASGRSGSCLQMLMEYRDLIPVSLFWRTVVSNYVFCGKNGVCDLLFRNVNGFQVSELFNITLPFDFE
jgi:hypothetical protein